ncbi:MAG: PhzF family phenazine biosynthesis protein [Ktedonobacterales bacterium]
MRRYRFVQLDVFTDKVFGGNQLVVFPEAAGLADAEMLAVAREMNYSETTFVLPPSDPKALRRVRIFTPTSELPLAGHPTVGTTFALAYEGAIHAYDEQPIYLELGVGTLPIDLLFEEEHLSFVWMHQPVPTFDAWQGSREQLAAALGLTVDDFDPELPIEFGSAGVPFLYIPIRSLEAIGRATGKADLPDVISPTGSHRNAYLFTLEPPASGVQAHVRMFAPEMGIAEDAATGAAAGPFGVYLLRHRRVTPDEQGEARLRLEQGIEMGRPCQITIAVATDGDKQARDVRIGGESVVVAEGTLFLP